MIIIVKLRLYQKVDDSVSTEGCSDAHPLYIRLRITAYESFATFSIDNMVVKIIVTANRCKTLEGNEASNTVNI